MFFSLEEDRGFQRVIKGIPLSRREVDTLACLLSGKGVKSIASLLSVSPRTIETYIRSVMLKFGCNSRDGIIDFIEKSSQISLLKDHYSHLLCQAAFKQSLQKVAKLHAQKDSVVLYSPTSTQTASFFLHQIMSCLELAGIKAAVELNSPPFFMGQETTSIVGVICRKEVSPHTPILFLLQGHPSLEKISQEVEEIGYVNFQMPEEESGKPVNELYMYMAFFEVLKKILPSVSFESILSEFKKQDISPDESSKYEGQKETFSEGAIFKHPLLFSKKLIVRGVVGAVLVVLLFLVIGHHFLKDKNQNSSIRSDLPVPHSKSSLDRSNVLAKIDHVFNSQQLGIQSVTLVGAGGAGKTTLARLFGRSQNNHLIWEINSETEESLYASFQNLAYALSRTSEQKSELNFIMQIPDIFTQKKHLLFYVKRRLKEESPWFLIYDNVEALSDIKDFIPDDQKVWGIGKMLITTRNINDKNTSYIDSKSVIFIEELEQADALKLFAKILYDLAPDKLTSFQTKEAIHLLKKIPRFPLDVSIAAFYIKKTMSSCDQYLDKIQEHIKEFDKSQEFILKNVNHYAKTRYGIISSSFERIIQINPDFKELLLLICLLGSQDIPKSFLESYKDTSVVEQFLYNLKKHALITHEFSVGQKKSRYTFSLHRSVQEMGLIFLKNLLSDKEKFKAINQMIDGIKLFKELSPDIKSYDDFSGAIDCPDRLLLLPHLEILGKRLEQLNLSEELNNTSQAYLSLLSGAIHYCCTLNILLSQKYLSQFFNQISTRCDCSIPPNLQALMVLVLGAIYIDLGNPNQGLLYLYKGLSLVEKIPGAEILKSEMLRLIGVAYSRNNEFEKSNHFFESALAALSLVDKLPKKNQEAETYLQLASSYSNYYLNKEPAYKAENYILKALEILGASHLFYETKEKDPKLLTLIVAKKKERLGEVYNRLGRYREAIIKGLREADYIIDQGHLSDHFFLKAEIDLNMGEALLREGNLEEAEQRLTNSLKTSEKTLGPAAACTWQARIHRAEVRFSLGKLDLAYEDCAFVLDLTIQETHPYGVLLHSTAFYYAAIIKYKQNDFEKAAKYFSDFFRKIKAFCGSFLDNKDYQDLVSKMVFDHTIHATLQDLKLCCQHSKFIFSAIYGASHPFVKDFVLKNAID